MSDYTQYMMVQSFQSYASSAIQTGSPVINLVLLMMFTVIMSMMLQSVSANSFSIALRWIKDKLKINRKVCVEYEGTIITTGEKIKVNLPIEITGINAHVSRKCKNIRKIHIIKEEAEGDDLSFLIEKCKDELIEDDIYITTYQYMRASNDSKVMFTHYSMEVSCKNHDINYILDKVEKWKLQVEDYFRDRYIKDEKCFVYWYNEAEFPMCKMKYEQYSIDPARTFNNLHFEGKELFMKKVDSFLTQKQSYTKVGKPHTLGILLYGDPGCGKTSIIKALANYTDRFIQYIPLQKVKTNTEFRRLFCSKYINDYKVEMDKKILVLEDIDCLSDVVLDRALEYRQIGDVGQTGDAQDYENKKNIVHISADEMKKMEQDKQKRKEQLEMLAMIKMMNANGKGNRNDPYENDKLCLSEILNCIDGPYRQDGRIMIITTNYPDRLDRALIRSGRVDIRLRLSLCTTEIANQIIKMYYEDAEEVHVPNCTVSPADLVGMCFGNTFEEFLRFTGFKLKRDLSQGSTNVSLKPTTILPSTTKAQPVPLPMPIEIIEQDDTNTNHLDQQSDMISYDDPLIMRKTKAVTKRNEPVIEPLDNPVDDVIIDEKPTTRTKSRSKSHSKSHSKTCSKSKVCDKCHKKKLNKN